jgi:ankyrin repeat protein
MKRAGHTVDEEFKAAILENDNKAIKQLLKLAMAEVKRLPEFTHGEWLYRATDAGHAKVVAQLLHAGAPVVNCPYPDEHSLLCKAIVRNRLAITKVLLDAGADANALCPVCKCTPLKCARKGYIHGFVVPLLRAGAKDVGDVDRGGRTLLQSASEDGPLNVVQQLIEGGVPVDTVDAQHCTALHLACKAKKPDIVQCLLKAGASVHKRDQSKRTPLHYAVSLRWRNDGVRALLEAGANVNAVDKDGETPLDIAVRDDSFDAAKTLMYAGGQFSQSPQIECASVRMCRELYPLIVRPMRRFVLGVGDEHSPISLLTGFPWIVKFIVAKALPHWWRSGSVEFELL